MYTEIFSLQGRTGKIHHRPSIIHPPPGLTRPQSSYNARGTGARGVMKTTGDESAYGKNKQTNKQINNQV